MPAPAPRTRRRWRDAHSRDARFRRRRNRQTERFAPGDHRLNVNLLGEVGARRCAPPPGRGVSLITREDVPTTFRSASGASEVVDHAGVSACPHRPTATTWTSSSRHGDHKDLDLTIAVFTAIPDQPGQRPRGRIVLLQLQPARLGALQLWWSGAHARGRGARASLSSRARTCLWR